MNDHHPRPKRLAVLIVLALVAGLVGFAVGEKVQFASSQVSFDEPVPMGYGAIQGVVAEGPSTLVNFYPPPLSSEIVLLADASGTTILQSHRADDQGRFRFIVPQGQYLVGLGRSGQPIKSLQKVDLDTLGIRNISLISQNP
jgi:hypothetical protein